MKTLTINASKLRDGHGIVDGSNRYYVVGTPRTLSNGVVVADVVAKNIYSDVSEVAELRVPRMAKVEIER